MLIHFDVVITARQRLLVQSSTNLQAQHRISIGYLVVRAAASVAPSRRQVFLFLLHRGQRLFLQCVRQNSISIGTNHVTSTTHNPP
jgi:hypothetical protein